LHHRNVRDFAKVAARAVAAAQTQKTVLPGQDIAAGIVTELATNILALHRRLQDLDSQIADPFDHHP
jgi:hypothetical protein